MSFWACGSILISNTTVGRFEPFYCNDKYFYRPQTKVIFLHLSVILFTGESTWAGTPLGRYTSSPPGQVPPRQVHPLAGTPPRQVHPPGQIHTPQAGTPPNGACCTVNKRAVRILLECILVVIEFAEFRKNILGKLNRLHWVNSFCFL